MFILKTIVSLLLLTAVSAVPDEFERELLMRGRAPVLGLRRDPVLGGSKYYTLKRDLRECLSPLCGGYFVYALNQRYTQCYDRRLSLDGCYVAALDLSSFADQSRFWEPSDGDVVLGSYKPTAYPDQEGRFADLAVEAGWVSLDEDTMSSFCDLCPDDQDRGPVCDCGPGEVCVDDPSDDCYGCACPTICRSISPIVCGSRCGGDRCAPCPPGLVCMVEDPFCGSDNCGSICVSVDERQNSCGGIAGLQCPFDQTCIYQEDCDPRSGADCVGVCVQKIGAFCGGIAGFPCGPGLACVDPLGDGCDNQCNGADCVGICLPDLDLVPRPPDDEDPVCDCGPDEVCVDDPSDRCLGCTCPTICRSKSPIACGDGFADCPPELLCMVEDPFCGRDVCESTCVAFDVRGITCGGINGWECLPGQTCIYKEDCDPRSGADCEGVCVQKIGAFCGGITGIQCGRGLTCEDPLGDGCDNQCYGADCGGICLPDLDLQPDGE